jgi:hypothetical protein
VTAQLRRRRHKTKRENKEDGTEVHTPRHHEVPIVGRHDRVVGAVP